MNGQWIGTYDGSSRGTIIVNIDERPSNFQGTAYLLESDSKLPSSTGGFRTADKAHTFRCKTDFINAVNPRTGLVETWDQVKKFFGEDVSFSQYADVIGTWDKDSLTLSWTSDTGAHGRCVLPRSKADQASELQAFDKTWSEFRSYVSEVTESRHLFRGQNRPWRLRTSFHRSGRADLLRYIFDDIVPLYRHLSARTKHLFNLQNPDENGAFFNLIQHHGYPSPLLDWTYSPYVAAFFAYRGISNKVAEAAGPSTKVRIHVFDQAKWRADWEQKVTLALPGPHVSIAEFIAIENERMIPQQAASLVTNLDDIETYIQSKEETSDKKYLWAIDLPITDRREVIRDLRYMGITAGSLFPGLDGACEELAERNFDL